MQALVPRYLEFSMENLTQEQSKFREQMTKAFGGSAFGGNPLDAIQAQTRANMQMFQEAFRLFNPFTAAAQAKQEAAAGAKPAAEAASGDLGDLKRELSEMRERLDKLSRSR